MLQLVSVQRYALFCCLLVSCFCFCRRVFGVSRNFSIYVSLLFGLLLSVFRSASCASIVGFGVCTCMFMCLLGSVQFPEVFAISHFLFCLV